MPPMAGMPYGPGGATPYGAPYGGGCMPGGRQPGGAPPIWKRGSARVGGSARKVRQYTGLAALQAAGCARAAHGRACASSHSAHHVRREARRVCKRVRQHAQVRARMQARRPPLRQLGAARRLAAVKGRCLRLRRLRLRRRRLLWRSAGLRGARSAASGLGSLARGAAPAPARGDTKRTRVSAPERVSAAAGGCYGRAKCCDGGGTLMAFARGHAR